MIDISKLAIGQKVHYKPAHYKEEEWENGLVKEIPDWSMDSVRVVYNCGGNWKEYKNYTGCLTNIRDLYLGWMVKEELSVLDEELKDRKIGEIIE